MRSVWLSRNVNPIEVEQFMNAVAQSPLSTLLLDYDGTLSPFCLDRRQALPYAGMTELLQEIIVNGRTRVVIITGRNAHEVIPLGMPWVGAIEAGWNPRDATRGRACAAGIG
jgi:trehalose-6-phosphatase